MLNRDSWVKFTPPIADFGEVDSDTVNEPELTVQNRSNRLLGPPLTRDEPPFRKFDPVELPFFGSYSDLCSPCRRIASLGRSFHDGVKFDDFPKLVALERECKRLQRQEQLKLVALDKFESHQNRARLAEPLLLRPFRIVDAAKVNIYSAFPF